MFMTQVRKHFQKCLRSLSWKTPVYLVSRPESDGKPRQNYFKTNKPGLKPENRDE